MLWQKTTKAILGIALIALVIIQFVRPEKNLKGYESVSVFETETRPSAKVGSILKANCYDCHSDQTQYPWYAEVAPLSLWLNAHIKDGKKHFNVSAWGQYSIKRKDHKLEEVLKMVENNKMPLRSYSFLRGHISEADKQLLLQWAGLARLQYRYRLEVSFSEF